jgi:D-beta-D-heptose 7-phosphate kinase/D-beta-D-heptose 1-phosphate adenosyltransferase
MKPKIPDFQPAHVLIVGDLMLDRYWYGDTSRISPEAPVPVVHVGDSEERAGGAGNVAINVTSLGAKATLIGLTGKDEAADALTSRLQDMSVSCQFEQLPGYSTVTKLRVLSRHQQLIRMDFEDGFHGYDPQGLLDRFHKNLPDAQVLLLSDYGKGSLLAIRELIDAARKLNKPIIVDPKGTDFEKYRGVTLLTPNLVEFEAVVGECSGDEDLVTKAQALRKQLDLQALLITRSDRGMTLVQKDADVEHIPTRAREVYDVTGAGDTVIAVLATAMAAGEDITSAMTLANIAAGVVVGKLGTAHVTVAEIRQAVREMDSVEQGVINKSRLAELVAEAKAHGETVVMTNGCFDILHEGHVAYLKQARELGDRLIVAVNSDQSVQKLKGEGRPVNRLSSRLAVLAGLESVDWVVSFDDDTPEELVCSLLPNVMVKGGDYQAKDIAGGACVEKAGGKIVIMDYVEGFSTSKTINTIRGVEKQNIKGSES